MPNTPSLDTLGAASTCSTVAVCGGAARGENGGAIQAGFMLDGKQSSGERLCIVAVPAR